MGLIKDISEAAARQHTPKNRLRCTTQRATHLRRHRTQSQRHRPMRARTVYGQTRSRHDGNRLVAIATAAAVPGTLVNPRRRWHRAATKSPSATPQARLQWCRSQTNKWRMDSHQTIMSRSAFLMSGEVHVPPRADCLKSISGLAVPANCCPSTCV